MLHESIDLMGIEGDGIYVDATFGAGGHSREILNRLGPDSKLLVFDQDQDATQNLIQDSRLIFIDSNFRYLANYLDYLKIEKIDGVLADLGVSSFQFDSEDRGFSYRFDAMLDMRMNQEMTLSANDILQKYPEAELVDLLSKYGEVRNSKTLAREIVKNRSQAIWTSQRFNALLDRLRMGTKPKYFAQVYQAIRIEVNDEMGALKDLLQASKKYLKKDGALVVISYHSVEDRIVKNVMKK
ncbi:UNVERIFIED_CONTAM: hypothetical protein GTU68_029992, partial [Idotea baltica]|nr:hypothetical protein [Idotea baltica]